MIYVDALRTHPMMGHRDAQARRVGARNGGRWCHLMADTPDELRDVARAIGLRPEWGQGDHFDLTPARRQAAIARGAVEVSPRVLVQVRGRWRSKGYQL